MPDTAITPAKVLPVESLTLLFQLQALHQPQCRLLIQPETNNKHEV
jgi:hypothetical protein